MNVIGGRAEGPRTVILGRMRPLQAESGRLPPKSSLNFHAKMSQYEMQRLQGRITAGRIGGGGAVCRGGADKKKRASATTI